MMVGRLTLPSALVVLLLGYLAAVLFLYVSQDQTLYPATTFSPEYAQALSSGQGLASWPVGALDPKGYVSESTSSTQLGTVIVFHGNGGSALDRGYYASAFGRLGYRVLLAEYPGYGARPGSYGERSFVSDALSTFDLAEAQFGSPLYVLGESLGAGVASAVARDRGRRVSGVALVTPWDSLPDLAQAKYPLLPARFLVKSKFDNTANLASYAGPKAVAMATADEIIPNAHTKRLYDTLGQPKRLWLFEGAGHNSWPVAADEQWWSELASFWATVESR